LSQIDGRAVNHYLCAVINKNGHPINVSCAETASNPAIVKSVTIKAGKIIVNKLTLGPQDCNANPTLKETSVFMLSGGKLVEQTTERRRSRITLDKNIENEYGAMLDEKDRTAIAQYLSINTQLKVATKKDRPQYVFRGGRAIRLKYQEIDRMNYPPFLIKGDFNGDGNVDLAICFIDHSVAYRKGEKRKTDTSPFSVIVFNGTLNNYSKHFILTKRDSLWYGGLEYISNYENGRPALSIEYGMGPGSVKYMWKNNKYIPVTPTLGP
jgi:hypothetical protein